jgi:hypothetical protein
MSSFQFTQSGGVGQIINTHISGIGGMNIYDNTNGTTTNNIVTINTLGDISCNNLHSSGKLSFTNSIESSCIIPRYTVTFPVGTGIEYNKTITFTINVSSIPVVRLFYCIVSSPTPNSSETLCEIPQNIWVWAGTGMVGAEIVWSSANQLTISTATYIAYTNGVLRQNGYYTIYVY